MSIPEHLNDARVLRTASLAGASPTGATRHVVDQAEREFGGRDWHAQDEGGR